MMSKLSTEHNARPDWVEPHQPTKEQLEAIISEVADKAYNHALRTADRDNATQAITALIQEARVDELLLLTNSADPLIFDRVWIASRIKQLSGGSNNESR